MTVPDNHCCNDNGSYEHSYLSYPLQTASSSSNYLQTNNTGISSQQRISHRHNDDLQVNPAPSNYRRGSHLSTSIVSSSMAVNHFLPRRIRRLFGVGSSSYQSPCCMCCGGISTAGKSRFLAICITVYIINLLLFLGAIATYVRFSQMATASVNTGHHQQSIDTADAMAIFATFQNSNNNRVMLAMNGGAVKKIESAAAAVDLMPGESIRDDKDFFEHRFSQEPTMRSRSASDKQLIHQRKAFIERKYPPGKLPYRYNQTGYVLFGRNDFFKFSSRVTTSLIYRFPLEKRVQRMFFDEVGENKLKALAPAIALNGDRILIFQRLWMSQNERAHLKSAPTLNTAVENYVIQRQMTLDYEPIDESTIVPIPVTTNCVSAFTYRTDGPMDARVFIINGTTYLSFHMWHVDAEMKLPRSRLFLWNEKTRQMAKFKIANYTMLWTEINWVPLVVNGSLYFTYSFDPLRVIHCPDLQGYPVVWCNMVFAASDSPKYVFNEWIDAFRGGGPWVHYQGPYFISFAHTHYQYVKERMTNETFVEGGIYSGNLAVLKVIPPTLTQTISFRIVYISEPLLFNHKLLLSGDITRSQIINWPFAFPVGSILWNGDIVDIGVHINDSRGYVVRLNGLLALMRRVIDADERNVESTLMDEFSEEAQPDIGLVHQIASETLQDLRDKTRSESFP